MFGHSPLNKLMSNEGEEDKIMRTEFSEGQLTGNALDVELPESGAPSEKTAGLRGVKGVERLEPEAPAKSPKKKIPR